jgi:uncharacterized membrane protein YbhN (UPF0104 family)
MPDQSTSRGAGSSGPDVGTGAAEPTPGRRILDVDEVSTYLFSADRTAPRRKRASDVVQFIAMALVFGLLAWSASGEPAFDSRFYEAVDDLPGWLRFFGWIGYVGSLLVIVVVLAVMLVRGGIGRGVLRDFTMSFLLIVVAGVAAGLLSTDSWPVLAPEFEDGSRLAFPTLRTSVVLAGAWVLAPYVTAPVQRAFRWAAGAAIVSPILLGLTTITHLLGAIALAAASVAAVRLLFGSPEGLPPVNRLSDTLVRAGIEAEDLAYLADQPGTVGLATARAPSGGNYTIKIYGEDAARRQQAERVWRAMWYHSSGPTPGAGRMVQAQNESLAMASCQLADVGAPQLVTAGQDIGGDVVVVSLDPVGTPVSMLDESRLDDACLSTLWRELRALHGEARIAHGRVGPETVWIDHDGAVSFVDLQHASTLPTETQMASDGAALLATIAIAAGTDRATDTAVTAVDRELLVRMLPFVQEAAIEPALRRDVKQAGFKLSDLRGELAERLDIEEPELAPVRRVSIQDIVMVAFAILAANLLISQIADVGFDVLIEEIQSASTGWLIAAFIIKLGSYSTAYISLSAVLTTKIPFAPTTLLQSAKSYVGLVVPSMVGRVGLDIRFLHKQGVPIVVAATQGPVISLIGFTTEVTLLLLTAWAIGQSVETEGLFDIDVGGLILLAIIVVVIGIVVVLVVPKLRNKVVPVVLETITAAKSIVASPVTLGKVYVGEMLQRLVDALALAAVIAAFGVDLSFAAIVFVSVGTGLLAGLAPVPGGIGVAEATMSALLTAVGVDAELSVSIAIVYRVVTAYLPPVLGFFSLNWLTKEGYL